MGVRYIVVPERLAPAPFAVESLPIPRAYTGSLAAQLARVPLDVPAGLSVFRNEAFLPTRAAVPADVALPEGGGIAAAVDLELGEAGEPVLEEQDGHLRWSGQLPASSSVFLSAAHSDRWKLSVDGEAAEHAKPFGWANRSEAHTSELQPLMRTPYAVSCMKKKKET